MAIKKYSKKKRVMRRRRVFPKRPSRSPMRNVVSIKRSFWYTNWTPNTTTTDGFYKYLCPTLANMPSYTEFTALWDQYRICGVKLTFRPRYDSFAGNDTTDTTLPGITNQAGCMLHYSIDPDGVGSAVTGTYSTTTLNAFLEQGNTRTRSGNREINIYYRPKTQVQGAQDSWRGAKRWLQTAIATNLNQCGVYVFAQDVNMTGSFGQSFDIFVTFYMQFRSLK